jgi:hypothetical protein
MAERLSKLIIEFEHVYRRSPDSKSVLPFQPFLLRISVLGKRSAPSNYGSADEIARYLARFGIYARQVWTLLQVALPRGQSKIIKACKAAMLLGHDMLDVETPSKQSLRNQTIFAAMNSSPPNFCCDITHEFCCNACLALSCQ